MDAESSRTLTSWAALLVRSREGDSVAFEELVRGCERRVLAIAYQITGDLEDAQDVAQESFLRLYRSRDRFQEERSFEAWLYRIVVNQARRALARRRRRHGPSLEEAGVDRFPDRAAISPADAAAASHVAGKLHKVLDALSPRLRTVFVLRDIQGMETREIARILSRTETTVRRHSVDARRRVRGLLEKNSKNL